MEKKQSPRLIESNLKPTSSFYKQQIKTLAGIPNNGLQRSSVERYSQNSEDPIKTDIEFTSKLPAITDLINLKTKDVDPAINSIIINLTKYAQNLEHVIRFKNKEIQRLEYINQYLVISQQKRDEMLTHVLEENRRLKELTLKLEKKATDRRLYAKSLTLQNTTLPSILPKSTQKGKHALNLFDDGQKTFKNNSSHDKQRLSFSSKSKFHQNRLKEEQTEQDILVMNEEELNTVFAENESLNILEDLLKSDDIFVEKVSNFDQSMLRKLYDAIFDFRTINRSLKQMVFKLKRIIKATISMTTSLVLDEAIERIVDEVCECLDCERATTFLYDNSKEELWSKASKGTQEIIRVSVNTGIVGHVFTKGEPLNIMNAYTDDKFNKEIDLKTGYKTNTILTVPIKDESAVGNGKRIIGVCQAINKRGHNTTFSKDDESLLTILSNLAGIVLRNSMVYDKQLSFHNSLRSALKNGVYLTAFHYFKDLVPMAERKLRDLMGVEKSKILLKNPLKEELFSYTENGIYQTYPINCGIFGKVIQIGEYESVSNAYNNPLFNGVVDIETSMPLLCLAVRHPTTDKVIGALQVINAKGIQGLTALQRANVDFLDLETLDFFTKHLARAVLNCFEWERLECVIKGEKYMFGDLPQSEIYIQQNLEKAKEHKIISQNIINSDEIV